MDRSYNIHGNHRLRQERIRNNWRQQDLAERLGTTVVTIKRWERGSQQPSAYFRAKLCALFGKDAEDLGLLPNEHPASGEETGMWSVPFPRNPFFTGRDLALKQLHTILTNKPTHAALTQSYALTGLGGVGKTQLVIEYAYQHRSEYQAVFWVEAETQASLTSSFVRFAELLALPERNEEDQRKIVAAVLRWLNRHEKWLLIFDNVEDLAPIKPFLPASDQGALLFTTRLQTLGTLARLIELPPMSIQEGSDFLLARTHRFRQGKENATAVDPRMKMVAEAIVTEMGGLPLALEQAGAYIDSTKCGLSGYLPLFQDRQYRLLDEHELSSVHPLSVSRTFSLAFEQIERRHPLAASILTVCAFLAPDAIPDMFFLEGASSLGPTFKTVEADPLAFLEAIKVLLSYSLIQRNATTRTITIHRLVQVVLRGRLTEVEQRSKGREVLETMVQLFPDEELQENYLSIGEQLVNHAQACLLLADQWNDNEALSIPLMSHVAIYLSRRGRYAEAEPLFEQAIQMGERALGARHPLVAEALHGLANLYRKQGKYIEAESLFERALSIREQTLGTQHPLVATSLDMLGYCYHQQGKYEQAEALFQRALRIQEQALAPEHPQIATTLNSLGTLYVEQGKYEQAELLYQRTLRIWEQALGSEHPQVATSLNNMGVIYFEQGKYEQAMPYYQRALHIWEQALGPEHPDLAFSLTGLGILYDEQGEYEQAETCYLRALRTWEQALGPEHPNVGFPLNNLGELYRQQGKYEQAEACYQRALSIREQNLGPEHPDLASPLHGLGEIYTQQGKYEQAEPLLRRALQLREQTWGSEHPDVASPLHGLANLLREQGKYEQAEPLYQRALMLRQRHLSSQHPDIAEALYDLARFYHLQWQTSKALSYYQQALDIYEQIYGSRHPKTKKAQDGQALLLQEMSQARSALVPEPEKASLCACGCGRQIDRGKSRGEPKRFFSEACKQRFYRNARRQRRNT